MKLTQASIRALKEPGLYKDDLYRGFAVRISKAGKKEYIYRCRKNGQDRVHNLGNVEVISLNEARKKMDEVHDKKDSQHFDSFMERFMNDYVLIHNKGHTLRDKEKYIKIISSYFKKESIRKITRSEIVLAFQDIGKKRGSVTANRVKSLLSKAFNVAIDWGVMETNPAHGIKPFPEKDRERFLDEKELPKWLEAVKEEPEPYKTFYLVCLLTGARSGEIKLMKWDDISNGLWTIKNTKNGSTHTLPLQKSALKAIEALPKKAEFVFVSQKDTPVNGFSRSWSRIKKRSGLDDIRIHDIRRTFGSTLANAGLSMQQIMKVMNHKTTKAALIYQRIDDKIKQEAVDVMAGRLPKGSI